MGLGGSKPTNPVIPSPPYEALERATLFTKSELKDIFARYEAVADEKTGYITKRVFLSIPEVAFCPIASLVFDKTAEKLKKDYLNFPEFVLLMNIFSVTMNPGDKLRYLFELVKRPGTPYMTKSDFSELFLAISGGSHVPPSVLQQLIDRSWNEILSKTSGVGGSVDTSHISRSNNTGSRNDSNFDEKDGVIEFAQFRHLASHFDLHSIMTIDY